MMQMFTGCDESQWRRQKTFFTDKMEQALEGYYSEFFDFFKNCNIYDEINKVQGEIVTESAASKRAVLSAVSAICQTPVPDPTITVVASTCGILIGSVEKWLEHKANLKKLGLKLNFLKKFLNAIKFVDLLTRQSLSNATTLKGFKIISKANALKEKVVAQLYCRFAFIIMALDKPQVEEFTVTLLSCIKKYLFSPKNTNWFSTPVECHLRAAFPIQNTRVFKELVCLKWRIGLGWSKRLREKDWPMYFNDESKKETTFEKPVHLSKVFYYADRLTLKFQTSNNKEIDAKSVISLKQITSSSRNYISRREPQPMTEYPPIVVASYIFNRLRCASQFRRCKYYGSDELLQFVKTYHMLYNITGWKDEEFQEVGVTSFLKDLCEILAAHQEPDEPEEKFAEESSDEEVEEDMNEESVCCPHCVADAALSSDDDETQQATLSIRPKAKIAELREKRKEALTVRNRHILLAEKGRDRIDSLNAKIAKLEL